MLIQQLKVELQKILTMKRMMVWSTIILLPSIIRFYMFKDSYVFYRPVEVYQELISGFIPLLFPIFMILVYCDTFVSEQKDNYLLYTRTRIWYPAYIWSKALTNALLAFIVSFLMVFLPFLFVFFIEPHLSIISYDPIGNNTLSSSTFDQLLVHGTFIYGISYSVWVAVNGVVYATLAFVLTLAIRNPFVALSLPFVWYQIMNFGTAIARIEIFSPISTIFPFNLEQQAIWTIFVPFALLGLIILCISLYLQKRQLDWMN